MKLQINNRIAIFIMSFVIWLLITSVTDIQEITAGLIVALLVALLSALLLTSTKIRVGFKKFFNLIIYGLVLLWEMVKANLFMAYIILNPKLPMNPGIIKIKTNLTNETALTILANSLTLTSGTLTMDVEQTSGCLYIHCIRVPEKTNNTEAISAKFEKRLKEIFE